MSDSGCQKVNRFSKKNSYSLCIDYADEPTNQLSSSQTLSTSLPAVTRNQRQFVSVYPNRLTVPDPYAESENRRSKRRGSFLMRQRSFDESDEAEVEIEMTSLERSSMGSPSTGTPTSCHNCGAHQGSANNLEVGFTFPANEPRVDPLRRASASNLAERSAEKFVPEIKRRKSMIRVTDL